MKFWLWPDRCYRWARRTDPSGMMNLVLLPTMIGGVATFILMLWGHVHLTPQSPTAYIFDRALLVLFIISVPCWLGYAGVRLLLEIAPAVLAIVRGARWMRRTAAPQWRSGWRAAGRIIGGLFRRTG
ncbi:hypothetical protein ACX0GZ_06290 [Sphingomonas aestuarii]